MNTWTLPRLLSSLHDEIQHKLTVARSSFGHPGAKGDASEAVWLRMLQTYLPARYCVESAFVVDSNGKFSDQIDVVIFDRQYSPFMFNFEGQYIIPAESVYAVFEAKQAINAEQVTYAQKKIASVRALHRTSVPIPHAGGVYKAKPPQHLLGGLLTFESDWKPGLGEPLIQALKDGSTLNNLELGCVAVHGVFECSLQEGPTLTAMPRAATAFLFELIARLQEMATVPMIDVRAYASWLGVDLD